MGPWLVPKSLSGDTWGVSSPPPELTVTAAAPVAATATAPPSTSGPTAVDLLTLGYTAISATILLARTVIGNHRLDDFTLGWLLAAHALLVLLIFLVGRARRAALPGRSALAEWYPVIILMAVYTSIGLVNGPRELLGQSLDGTVLHWESHVWGPLSLERWGGHTGAPWLDWGLGISYLAFFPMVIAAPLVLWMKGQVEHARRAIFGITLAFLLCYVIFLLFPVAGPAYVMGWPSTQAGTDLPIRLVRFINDYGDSWGSAFPSSHVAASMTALFLARTGCRKTGAALAPIAVGIILAVVYFRVHYVVDAVAGLALAAVVAFAVCRAWPVEAARQ